MFGHQIQNKSEGDQIAMHYNFELWVTHHLTISSFQQQKMALIQISEKI